MSILLHIDTAVVSASVCLSENDRVIATASNPEQKDHASWLHTAIEELFQKASLDLQQTDAISLSYGPGSYTGLRVGMATAKGLCYALQKPLITVSTLAMMTQAALPASTDYLCPMIDARRMEVFTALFNTHGEMISQPTPMILEPASYGEILTDRRILFFGNGSEKFKAICQHPNAFFAEVQAGAKDLVPLAWRSFQAGEFADLAYSEPYYGKDFHSSTVKA